MISSFVAGLLALTARFGRWVLVAGLVAGFALPSLALVLQDWIAHLVVLLLFLNALRLVPDDIVGSVRNLPILIGVVLCLQLVLPLIVLGLAGLAGLANNPVTFALVLMACAPSIAGGPGICVLMGFGPTIALRLLIVGTALLPVTVLPVFWLMPEFGAMKDVIATALNLLALILLATLVAILTRRAFFANPGPVFVVNLDGLTAITLAVLVIGLMPALAEAVFQTPLLAAYWILIALAANFGLQLAAFLMLRSRVATNFAVPVSLVAGNRNIVLFLAALPPDITAPIMIFIGCYQLPMYLTPLVMRKVYATAFHV
ncbi:MAG: hypothetical protein GY952_19805 [Rhodobacteraceae bacterium]|nr:hypothetical protein [Paracoccaceae bacterium]